MGKNKVTVKQFREDCKKYDKNVVDRFDKTQFKLICMKCGSEKCYIVQNLRVIEQGYPSTGFYASAYGGILIKCLNCGNAQEILDGEADIEIDG